MRAILQFACAFAVVALASVLPGCDKDEAAGDVFGSWCGKAVSDRSACVGDEVIYLEVAVADGAGVTGVQCEAYGKECYALIDSEQTAGKLRYAYEFSGNRVDAELELASGGDTLQGVLTSTKCGGCQTPVTLFRIPE